MADRLDGCGQMEKEKEPGDEFAFCEDYKRFLDCAKTEREAVRALIAELEGDGFVPYDRSKIWRPGDRIYFNQRNKALILAVIGERGLAKGARLAAAHIDSPRLDVKPAPLYAQEGLAFFKTHYYGSLRKYQWAAIPLALHGCVCLSDGEMVDICIGEKKGEPQFTVSDLLPHLASGFTPRPVDEIITGERLNVMIGSGNRENGGEFLKDEVLRLLKEFYGIEEQDFWSAELCFVPAFGSTDVGIDRSLIGAYGQDDTVCAYPAVQALRGLKIPENTCIVVLADKEETGNGSTTGMDSTYMDDFIEDLAEGEGLKLRHVYAMSRSLSVDVSSAYDPNYPEAFDPLNTAYLNKGPILQKYSGLRGKSETADACAEYLGELRTILKQEQIAYQIGEIGKVDCGGGKTISRCLAVRNLQTADLGVPVLSMHAPFEITSKRDIYLLYRGISAFFHTPI